MNYYRNDNISFNEIRELTGLSKSEFSLRYNIPSRTIANWESRAEIKFGNDIKAYLKFLIFDDVLANFQFSQENINYLEKLGCDYKSNVAVIQISDDCSIKDLVKLTGTTMAKFAGFFWIPKRTLENWTSSGINHRECPEYVKHLVKEAVSRHIDELRAL